MNTPTTRRFFLAATLLTAACATDATSTASRAIIETACVADTDCPTGFECEIEVEHGITTSFCQADDDSDGTCPAGYELEVEHGQTFCKLHGGGNGGGSGNGGTSAACVTDADCGAGLECEVEVEHGETSSSCKPHGGA
ncbi:hypothetical protein BH11MYX3_BH11MYX3_38630 [soil metagenome]